MVASPTTTYLYAISLILVYGSLGLAFAVGASGTAFAINAVVCIMSLALIRGLQCARTGKTVYVAPHYQTTTQYQQRSDGTHAVTSTSWNPGGTYSARYYGLLFGILSIFFGLLIGIGGDMAEVDTFPVTTLLASTIIAIIGAMAYKPS